ncbi:hypothetical protein M885DRAFT_540331 [Pelagophyceae sp. CCMP2097]|nr:hypothetical protein M885DRAFT_540331 [Pelagophyceae sp. CCMP2097]
MLRILSLAAVARAARELRGGGSFPVSTETTYAVFEVSLVFDDIVPSEFNADADAQSAYAITVAEALTEAGNPTAESDVTDIFASAGSARRRLLGGNKNTEIMCNVTGEVDDEADAEVRMKNITKTLTKQVNNGKFETNVKAQALLKGSAAFANSTLDKARSAVAIALTKVSTTVEATAKPSVTPTIDPTISPVPTAMPTAKPAPAPSAEPTLSPTGFPSVPPTSNPSPAPTAFMPTPGPTANFPTPGPTVSSYPTGKPTAVPTPIPTAAPSAKPTAAPSSYPTFHTPVPTPAPTSYPTFHTPLPTTVPTSYPTFHTEHPTGVPTAAPSYFTPVPTAPP